MTTFDAIRQSISPELEMLNKQIASALASSNALMNQVVDGYLQRKGKLIRPILVILTAKLFGDAGEKTLAAAAAVEMLHNASLIHDDVVDESKLRRGVETINAVWDNHIAVLVGDFFVSSALQQALSTGDIRIVDSLSILGKTLSLGEIDQLYNARYHCLDEKAYFSIIGSKTASLFVSCVRMGAFSVGVDESDPRLTDLSRFAELLGLCFQIKDDIFDYYPSETVGKPTGNDLREGKITLPLLYALTTAPQPERNEMLELSHREPLDDEQIARLVDFAKRSGGIEYAFRRMEELRSEGVALLQRVAPDERTADFRALFDYIITRDR